MSANLVRLESFSRPEPPAAPVTSHDLEAEYFRGVEQGQAIARHEAIDRLSCGLADMTSQLASRNETLARAREDISAAMLPVLHALTGLLAPLTMRDRLRDVLSAELQALLGRSAPVKLRIRCHADLRETVETCVAEHPMPGIELETVPITEPAMTLSFEGGDLVFDPGAVTARLEALIRDSLEGNRHD